MSGDIHIISVPRPERLIEICRSFSRKFNLQNYGGPQYEAVDFFASRKQECLESEAHEVSSRLYAECEAEVMTAAREFIGRMKAAQRKSAAKEEAA